jgi:hypothetical protein
MESREEKCHAVWYSNGLARTQEPRRRLLFLFVQDKDYNSRNKQDISYPDIPSAMRPVPHGPDVPIPVLPKSLEAATSESSTNESNAEDATDCYLPDKTDDRPQPFTQIELNDLVRDLGLTKDCAEILGSRLKAKNLLSADTSFSWYRYREKEFVPYFAHDGQLVYCCDIPGLVCKLGGSDIVYQSSDWRLLIRQKQVIKAFSFIMETNMPLFQ